MLVYAGKYLHYLTLDLPSQLFQSLTTVNILHQPFHSKVLDNILDIECAGGTPLPYTGYIEANIKMPGDTNTTCQHVMLVVPDSRYSQHIPALIGTNILDKLMYHLQEEHGVRYLQNAALTTPWFLTFRCLSMREKELTKNNDRLAVIRTCNRITILPNNS
jgi:hypothetical protein